MFRVAILIWVVAATTLAGVALTAILMVPAWSAHPLGLIGWGVLAAAIVAVPISMAVAKAVSAKMN